MTECKHSCVFCWEIPSREGGLNEEQVRAVVEEMLQGDENKEDE